MGDHKKYNAANQPNTNISKCNLYIATKHKHTAYIYAGLGHSALHPMQQKVNASNQLHP